MSDRIINIDVVVTGIRDGELSPEQGAALLRSSMPYMCSSVLERLEGFLHEPSNKDGTDLNDPVGRLLDFAWKVCGPVQVFCQVHTHKVPLVSLFFEMKFRDALDEVSETDLETCAKVSRSWPLHGLVKRAQARKLVPLANLLLRNPRDLNQDIAAVQNRVSEYNFPPELNEVLDKVEAELAAGGDQFDQAASLKHLRTFFEKLHEQVGLRIRAEQVPLSADATDFTKCQQTIDYLERHGVLTDKMKALGRALYGVQSEEGVHSLKADPEYVRLCRNMVAEYALVLFFELERLLNTRLSG